MGTATHTMTSPFQTDARSQTVRAVAPSATAKPKDMHVENLLRRARQGDEAALAEIYDTFSPALYGYLCKRSGDPDLAEDLTATVFLKVLEAIHGERAWNGSFTGWLYRIANNLYIDHWRAAGRRPVTSLPDTLPAQTDDPLDERMDWALMAEDIRGALDEVRPDYAQILLLRFADGLSHAAVARMMGKTEGAVKVAQHRALKALRRRLALRTNLQPVAA